MARAGSVFAAIIKLIQAHGIELIVLEHDRHSTPSLNSMKRRPCQAINADVCQRRLAEEAGFWTMIFEANSFWTGTPQHRSRVYIIGVPRKFLYHMSLRQRRRAVRLHQLHNGRKTNNTLLVHNVLDSQAPRAFEL